MKFRFRVAEFTALPKDKGFVISFESPYGERVGAYVRSSQEFEDIKKRYPLQSVHLLDLRPYIDKNNLAKLTIEIPADVVEHELF